MKTLMMKLNQGHKLSVHLLTYWILAGFLLGCNTKHEISDVNAGSGPANSGPNGSLSATLSAFQVLEPQGVSSNRFPVIRWSASQGTSVYAVSISQDSQCQNVVAGPFNATQTRYEITDALDDGDYFACVSASNGAGDNLLGAPAAFSIDTTGPASFAILAPVGVTRFADSIARWNSAQGAISYSVQIGLVDCNENLRSGSVIGTSLSVAPALAEGDYQICVTAEDAVGNASTSVATFTIDRTAPGAFDLTGPATNVSSLNPTVSWTESVEAVAYDIRIGAQTDINCASPLRSLTTSSLSAIVTPALTAGSYYACVSSRDEAGNSYVANSRAFNIDNIPPAAFSVIAPLGSSQNIRPDFSWSASSGATSYRLRVAANSTCNAPTLIDVTQGATDYTALSDLPEGDYWTCVTAEDLAGNATNAVPTPFRIDLTPPGGFNITGPIGLSTVNPPVISWSASSGAAKYLGKVSRDANCNSPIESFEQSNLSTPLSIALSTRLGDGTHYVCMESQDAAGNRRSANNIGSFLIDAIAPSSFAVNGPTSPTNNRNPLVEWDAAVGADFYRVRIGSDSNCSGATDSPPLTGTSYVRPEPLADGNYFACVIAFDNSGNNTLVSLGFRVDATPSGAFEVTGPANLVNQLLPTITWTNSSDAVAYDVRVGLNSGCDMNTPPLASVASSPYIYSNTDPALEQRTYFACITARDELDNERTVSRAFTVDTIAPLSFTIGGPAALDNENRPVIQWTGPSDAVRYTVQVGSNDDCSEPSPLPFEVEIQQPSSQNLSQQVTNELLDGGYFACVTAFDAAGNPRLEKREFTVDTQKSDPFLIREPVAIGNNSSPFIRWDVSSGETVNYEVRVGQSVGCADADANTYPITVSNTELQVTLAEGSYYACVNAIDLAGNVQSAPDYAFEIDLTPPADFEITPQGAINLSQPTIRWNAAGDNTYDVEVLNQGGSQVASATGISALELSLSGPLSEGSYTVTVIASDAAGNSHTETGSFTVDLSPPQPVTITSPSGLISLRSPTVSWDASPSANPPSNETITYQVLIGSDGNCSTDIQENVDGLSVTQYDVQASLQDGRYYACVIASDAAGNPSTLQSSEFQVDATPPAAFQITSPVGFSNTVRPTITWEQPSTGESSYEVIVSRNANCSDSPSNLSSGRISVNEFPLNADLQESNDPNTPITYYSCVTAFDLAGNSTTQIAEFVVDTQPPADFAVTAPDTRINNQRPTVVWEAAAGATSYTARISPVSGSGPTIESGTLTATTFSFPASANPLDAGKYFAHVTAFDAAGNAKDSQKTFVVDLIPPAAFSILEPAHLVKKPTTVVRWESAADPNDPNSSLDGIEYEFVLSTTADCQTAVQQERTADTQVEVNDLVNGIYYPCVTAEDDAGNTRVASNSGAQNLPGFSFEVLLRDQTPRLVTGAGETGGSHVRTFNLETNDPSFDLFAYPNFTGGVRVAFGDVDRDGIVDLITGAGPGGGPHVKVFKGPLYTQLIRDFFAFDNDDNPDNLNTHSLGIYVASGDVNGDGFDDIIVGEDAGNITGVRVNVFSGQDEKIILVNQLQPYAFFAGGVRVAAGDFDNDGVDEFITGAADGGGPHLKIYSYEEGKAPIERNSFFPYPDKFPNGQPYRGGIYVAAGDVDGDGREDLVVGSGRGLSNRVKVLNNVVLGQPGNVPELLEFDVTEGQRLDGAPVACTDIDGDGRSEIITGAGFGGEAKVRIFQYDPTTNSAEKIEEIQAYNPGHIGGVFVGGAP